MEFLDQSVFQFTDQQILSLFPFFVLFFTIFLACVGAGLKWSRVIQRSIVGGGLSICAFLFLFDIKEQSLFLFGSTLIIDSVNRLTAASVCGLAVLAALFSGNYKGRNTHPEWAVFLLVAVLGAILMPMASDFVSFFVFLECFSIASYLLASLDTHRVKSIEAGMKYLLMGSLASAFMLMGIVLLYAVSGSFSYVDLQSIVQQQLIAPSFFCTAGSILLLTGLSFKVAVVPFHMWAPDVYKGAPTSSVAFLATGAKVVGIVAMVNILARTSLIESDVVRGTLMVVGTLSVLIANSLAFVQTHIKRMFAYASIASVGYASFAVAVGTEALSSLLFYLVQYGITFIGIFAFIEYFVRKSNIPSSEDLEIAKLSKLRGVVPSWTLGLFALAVFSLAALPPLPGFLGKYVLLRDLWYAGDLYSMLVVILGSLLGFGYYLKIFIPLFLKDSPEKKAEKAPLVPSNPWKATLTIALFAQLLLFLSLFGFSRLYKWMNIIENFSR